MLLKCPETTHTGVVGLPLTHHTHNTHMTHHTFCKFTKKNKEKNSCDLYQLIKTVPEKVDKIFVDEVCCFDNTNV